MVVTVLKGALTLYHAMTTFDAPHPPGECLLKTLLEKEKNVGYHHFLLSPQ